MSYSKKLLAPMVSAAIVLIVVTNYCIIQILGSPNESPSELLSLVWPIALPSSVAVILIMSTLFHTCEEVIGELEFRRLKAMDEAHHDPLTGLANKRLLEERIEQAIARYRRSSEKFSLLMIDLDHFKRVNDLHGHQIGDDLLKQASVRLKHLVRETDTVARFGGDEFLILLTGITRPSNVRQLCARIARQMQIPFDLGNREARLGASIGAVIATDRLRDAADYIRASDTALYAAKASGRNCYRSFTDELDSQLRRRDQLESGLRKSLRSGDGLAVKFQPQLDVKGEVVGAEALFRWCHPELGDIPAAEAVAVAEESYLIQDLSNYVIRKAARFARQWSSLSVAINISPAQFAQTKNLPEELQKIVISEGIRTDQLELEITEQLFMREYDGCDEQVARLRECGFRVALDDFGTGYSSLNYLRRFKVDRLKLDRSFACTAESHQSVAVVRAAVSLAHSLDLEVVAEGIETELQESVAFEAGCDIVQGNLYGPAMIEDEFADYMERRHSAAA